MNVIIITSDEMRGDCPGFMGNHDCKTPNLDAFAGRATVFANHFAVHGKCVPSRISMVTGRYCHTDGFRTIHQHLPADQPDLMKHLRQQGYETAVFGHNHVWEDFWGDNSRSSGCVDYHSYTSNVFAPMLEREWPVPAPAATADIPVEIGDGDRRYRGRVEKPLSGFCDDNRVEQAIHYLRKVRDQDRPFYLHVNLGKPHPPYCIEEPYYSMYDRDGITSWPHALPNAAPLPLRRMREVRTGMEVPEAELREMQAVYYGMITKTDMLLGRLLAAVEELGLLDDSVLLFTVDHGDFAGQYGLCEKWDTCMADCILHVPLIIHAPGLSAGGRVEALTGHVDIAPTIFEILGLEPDWGMHGDSLVSAAGAGYAGDAVFADGGHEREMWARFNHASAEPENILDGKQRTYKEFPETMARTKMVRTREWKLVVRETGGNELYDLRRDPWELENLWDRRHRDSGLVQVVVELQQRMLEWCLRTDTDRPRQEQVGA